ncbi:hypothetical protein [Siccirubricoccus phaeus]|uniref:hypothetical protein n=1 Tax=Siccirubricoccus phaeus TaxID=2595053 RepID=UPI0011F2F153|nr:hypothetical protein [Siccirubricoccus phaeus]
MNWLLTDVHRRVTDNHDAERYREGKALRSCRPRLAISFCHQPEDLFAIPLWLHGLGLGYRFFLDRYTIFDEETVLYATADQVIRLNVRNSRLLRRTFSPGAER